MELTIHRGKETMVYRYEPGDEPLVMEALIEHVHKGLIGWFDAMILSHQIGYPITAFIHQHNDGVDDES